MQMETKEMLEACDITDEMMDSGFWTPIVAPHKPQHKQKKFIPYSDVAKKKSEISAKIMELDETKCLPRSVRRKLAKEILKRTKKKGT